MIGYYVTIIRDTRGARKAGFLLGPFNTEQEAHGRIPAARAAAEAVDPLTAFDLFGTARLEAPTLAPGVLNERCGYAAV